MDAEVIVTLESGDQYFASFITYKRLKELIEENRQNGTFLSGKYFWIKNMVLIRDFNEYKEVINDMVDEGDFQLIFEKV